jgi:RNA polymerase sigma-70 factor, ECF subfamily
MNPGDRDLQLVEALRRRDPTAAERLATIYGERAYRLAVSVTGNGADAEEAVQDACWNVIRKIDTFRADAAFGSWFYRIVANASYAKRRAQQRRRDDLPLDDLLPVFDEHGRHAMPMVDWSPDAEDVAVQTELRQVLTAAISELPDGYRMAVMLRDVQGLSQVEIATALGLTVANVKTRVHRARLFLRKRLGEVLAPDFATAA